MPLVLHTSLALPPKAAPHVPNPCVAAGNRTLLPCGRRAGRHLLFLYIEHDANLRCVRRRRVCNLVVMAAAGTRTAGLVGPAMAHQSGAATRFFDCLRRPACKPGLLGNFRRRPTPTALKLELYYNITCELAGVRGAHRFVRPTAAASFRRSNTLLRRTCTFYVCIQQHSIH